MKKDLTKRTAMKYVEREYFYDLKNCPRRDELCKKVLFGELKDLSQLTQSPSVLKKKELIKIYLAKF